MMEHLFDYIRWIKIGTGILLILIFILTLGKVKINSNPSKNIKFLGLSALILGALELFLKVSFLFDDIE